MYLILLLLWSVAVMRRYGIPNILWDNSGFGGSNSRLQRLKFPVYTAAGICRQRLICLILLTAKPRLSGQSRQIPGSTGKTGKPVSRGTALGASSSGPSIARGTSFLKDRLGERIFAEAITIIDEPHRHRGCDQSRSTARASPSPGRKGLAGSVGTDTIEISSVGPRKSHAQSARSYGEKSVF
jgi:hypothetical protein